MLRHELLKNLHELLKPRTYFEIGVNYGSSLTLSRTRTVAVDPFYKVTREVQCDVHLVRATSDEFFARKHPLAHFDEPVIDLAFIDGMHL
ncbi:MAG: class I SAM-dependent methyltransferase, partial [Nocardioides sp.]